MAAAVYHTWDQAVCMHRHFNTEPGCFMWKSSAQSNESMRVSLKLSLLCMQRFPQSRNFCFAKPLRLSLLSGSSWSLFPNSSSVPGSSPRLSIVSSFLPISPASSKLDYLQTSPTLGLNSSSILFHALSLPNLIPLSVPVLAHCGPIQKYPPLPQF